jgi:hypothetical protein
MNKQKSFLILAILVGGAGIIIGSISIFSILDNIPK